MREIPDTYKRDKIKISVGFFKRKVVRKALEAIIFDKTTKYVRAWERKLPFKSDFSIEICGEEDLVSRMIVLIAALGDVA